MTFVLRLQPPLHEKIFEYDNFNYKLNLHKIKFVAQCDWKKIYSRDSCESETILLNLAFVQCNRVRRLDLGKGSLIKAKCKNNNETLC